MSKKEIIAYAITHAPKGVKGGPYEGLGDYGSPASSLRHAERWKAPLSPYSYTLARVRQVHPHARVIRIVRKARPFKETIPVCGTCGYDAHGGRDEESEPAPSPSEASAVEVMRDIVAILEKYPLEDTPRALIKARRVLAASGPDPMPVVRAAMRYLDHGPDGRLGPAWMGFREACEAYREAGGK